jgi:hypothetical protein
MENTKPTETPAAPPATPPAAPATPPAATPPVTPPAEPQKAAGDPKPSGAEYAAKDYKEQRDKARADLEALQKRIADLEGNAKEVTDLKAQLEKEKADRAKEATDLEAKRVNTVRLTQAGCVDVDVALGLLNEHADVDKLKDEKPYLFGTKPTGSTGGKPGGPPATGDAKNIKEGLAATWKG